MDDFDRRILASLQKDSARPIALLAEEIGLSLSACHRRVRLLEERGIIRGYKAELDMAALGLDLEIFVEISLSSQGVETLNAFEKEVVCHREILDCWLTAGGSDYQLRLVAGDMKDYERIHREVLARLPGVSTMHTKFVLRKVSGSTGIPL